MLIKMFKILLVSGLLQANYILNSLINPNFVSSYPIEGTSNDNIGNVREDVSNNNSDKILNESATNELYKSTTEATPQAIPAPGVRRIPESETNDSPELQDSDSTELFESITLADLKKECKKVSSCIISGKEWYVCGNDGRTYQNLGVFICAQRCKKDLKLKSFHPCENANKKTTRKPTPWRTTTPESILKVLRRNLTLALSKKLNKTNEDAIEEEETPVDPDLVKIIVRRIKERQTLNPLSPEERKWCRQNPKQCYFGFDPSYDPILYLIPVKEYSSKYKLRKQPRKNPLRII